MGIHVPPAAEQSPTAPPGALYQAIAGEQLGLKLEAQMTLAQVLVIDHAERPAED